MYSTFFLEKFRKKFKKKAPKKVAKMYYIVEDIYFLSIFYFFQGYFFNTLDFAYGIAL